MILFTHYGFRILNNYLNILQIPKPYVISTFLIVILAILVYMVSLIIFKEIKYSDLNMIPYVGNPIAEFLRKYNVL